ncbi:hypothetical protein SUGI_0620490 [Cryptomeria japonica]|nr:hypothetical protein SUGI_0620490 [Cryptomeria japonica]
MSSCSKPKASLKVPSLGASASVGCTDVSGSSNGIAHAGDDVHVVPPLTSASCVDSVACVSSADCSSFGVSRGSYADRLAFGRGKGSTHVETKPFPVCQSIAINLEEKTVELIDQVVSDLSSTAVICRFRGFRPSLPGLHEWISKHWEPLISESVQIFPLAKGFFIAKFDKVMDRKIILCDHFFWENRFPLMIKPWHEDINPSSESFCKMPIWVRLPNLPLHLWVDQLLEEVGEALGDFLMVDVESPDILHSTYARILVDIDASKGLPTKIKLSTPKGFWIPFRCRRCFKNGHVVAKCDLEKVKVKKPSSWWEGTSSQHYMVFKSSSQMVGQDLPINGSKVPVVDYVGSVPLVPGTGFDTSSVDVVDGVVPSANIVPSEPSGGPDILQIVGSAPVAGCDRILDGTSTGATPIPIFVYVSISVSSSNASVGVVPLSVSSSREVPGPGSVGPAGSSMFVGPSLGVGFLALDSLEWQVEDAKVEEG